MSEAELHFLAGRLQGAKRAAAERGELRFPLPVGFVYDDDGNTIIDPDAEVQAAVADVFAAFRAGGSAYQVVAAFKGRRFPLRAYGGVWAGQLRWGRLTHSRVLGILANPAYAGTYVFGRYHSRRVVSPDGVVSTKTVELPRDEWPVVIHDHHPGYIGWDDYLTNQARLAANLTNAGARPPREGHALCQGIIGCGSCGRPMTTRYHRNGHAAYECSASRADQMATATCRSITAATVDDAVAARLLDALNPDEVALALAAADEVADRRARQQPGRRAGRGTGPLRSRTRRTRLPRLRTGEPARRPQPRSPLGSPPRRPRRSRQDTRPAARRRPTAAVTGRARSAHRRRVGAVARPDHRSPGPQTTAAHPHRRRHPAPRTGPRQGPRRDPLAHRRHRRTRRRPPSSRRRVPPHRPRRHRARPPSRPTSRQPRPRRRAQRRRLHHRRRPPLRQRRRVLAAPLPPASRHPGCSHDGEVTVAEAARRLGISHGAVIHWINRGSSPPDAVSTTSGASRSGPTSKHACRQRVAASVHLPRVDDPTPADDDERTVGQVAAALGISTNVVYYWIEHDHVDARRGPGGRWLITFSAIAQAACRQRVAASVHLKPIPQPQTPRSHEPGGSMKPSSRPIATGSCKPR